MRSIALLLAAVAASLSGAASAQTPGSWYFGGAIGQARAHDLCTDLPPGLTAVSCEERAGALKGFVGFTITRHLAIEGTVIQTAAFSGRFNIGGTVVDTKVNATSVGAAAVGSLPLGDALALFGKLGYARTEARARLPGTDEYIGAAATGVHLGAGGRFALSRHWAFRAEWERLRRGDYDLYTLGAEYRF